MDASKLQFPKLNEKEKEIYFKYVIIAFGIITLFSYKTIKLNILFGFIVSSIIIYVLYKTRTNILDTEKNIKKEKRDNLLEVDKGVLDKDDIVDILLTVEEYYDINPQAYNEMISNLEIFFKHYNTAIKDNTKSSICFENMEIYKDQILSALHSFIFKIKSDKVKVRKLNDIVSNMDDLLIKYQNEIYDAHLNYIHDNGYNHNTKIIVPELKQPYNMYNTYSGEKYDISNRYSYNIY